MTRPIDTGVHHCRAHHEDERDGTAREAFVAAIPNALGADRKHPGPGFGSMPVKTKTYGTEQYA
jgi:hypothetical protein